MRKGEEGGGRKRKEKEGERGNTRKHEEGGTRRKEEEGGGRVRTEAEGKGRRRKEKEETRGRRNEEEGVGRVRKRRDQIQRPSRASKGKLCFHVFFFNGAPNLWFVEKRFQTSCPKPIQ